MKGLGGWGGGGTDGVRMVVAHYAHYARQQIAARYAHCARQQLADSRPTVHTAVETQYYLVQQHSRTRTRHVPEVCGTIPYWCGTIHVGNPKGRKTRPSHHHRRPPLDWGMACLVTAALLLHMMLDGSERMADLPHWLPIRTEYP